jgi:hypothetical protein
MSDCTAEIAALPFKPGTDLTTGPSAKIWAETLTTITSQPGCKAVHWGRQVERPDVIQLAVGTPSMQPQVKSRGKLKLKLHI